MAKTLNKWHWMVAVVLLAIATIRLPSTDTRAVFEYLFTMMVMYLFAVFIMDRVNLWAGLFLLLALVSYTLPAMLFSNFKQTNTLISYSSIHNIMLGMILYVIIIMQCSNIERILDIMCVLVIINVAFVFLQFNKLNPLLLWGFTFKDASPVVGLMANPNETGAFIGICSPAFFRGNWKWFWNIPLIGLMFMPSAKSGVIGYFAAVAVLVLLKSKWSLILPSVLPLLILTSTCFLVMFFPEKERFYIWGKALDLFILNKSKALPQM